MSDRAFHCKSSAGVGEAMEAMGEWRKQPYVVQQDVGRRPAAVQVGEACLYVRSIAY
jgi:hypothetical protein